MTAPVPVGVHLLAPALPRFRERHPRLSVDLRLGDRFADLVEEGIDVAIRVGELSDSRLVSRRLAPHGSARFVARLPGARGTPRHPDELVDHDCVNFRFQSTGQALRWPFRIGGRTVELAPDAGIVTDFSDAVATILVAGGGIGISPTYIAAPYVERGLLVPVLKEFASSVPSSPRCGREPSRQPEREGVPGFPRGGVPVPGPWDGKLAVLALHKDPGMGPRHEGDSGAPRRRASLTPS